MEFRPYEGDQNLWLHDDLDEGSQQWRKTLLALNLLREIVLCPDNMYVCQLPVHLTYIR